MPESVPVFDALDASPALQIDCADVNIAELPQDVDALKSIIARLLQASSIQEREYARNLDQIELRLRQLGDIDVSSIDLKRWGSIERIKNRD